jgi:exosome complex RNA-binding protein Csl4
MGTPDDRERGDIILGWLTRVTASLAILGVVGFDAVSLGAGRFQAEDHAQKAARAGVESYRDTKDLQRAYDAALAEVVADGDTLDADAFTAGPDGSITLRLRREVPTVLVEKIGPLREWATVTRTVTGSPAR